jgi:hypothetical protein
MKSTVLLTVSVLLLIGCSSKPNVEGKWKNDTGIVLYLEKDNAAYLTQEGQPKKDKAQYHTNKDSVIVKQVIPNMPNAFVETSFLIEKDQLKLVQMFQSVAGDERTIKNEALAQQLRLPPASLIFKRSK